MRRFLAVCFLLFCVTSTIAWADAVSEMASFSVFGSVDLGELAGSGPKTMHGPPMGGRFLSVQSCYLMSGSPAQQIDAIRRWNPARHSELKVFLHGDLPNSPTVANFARLKNAPNNGPIQAFVSQTQQGGSELQINKAEAKNLPTGATGGGAMPGPVVKFWGELLANRARSLNSGGTASQPPYDNTGENIRPNDELNSLVKQQDKIRKQFSGFLSQTAIGRGSGAISPELYWELLNVDDRGVVTLGAYYNKAAANGAYQAADVLYYASGGYYVSLTLYQMWPVSVQGKASTLVWRGDMISSASLGSLHGVERLGSEAAMMKEISKAITFFRQDMAR
jgi:hypothetical protein